MVNQMLVEGRVLDLNEMELELAWSNYLSLEVCVLHCTYNQESVEVNHTQNIDLFPIPLCDLESDDTAHSFFIDFLSRMGVTTDDDLLRNLLSVCRVTNAERTRIALTTATPLVAAVHVLITIQAPEGGQFEFGDETSAVIQAMEESMVALQIVPANQASLNALEKVRVDRSCSMDRCMVCLEELCVDDQLDQLVTRMPCSHVYHEDCIIRWLKTSHFCPVCRFEMPT